MAGSLKKMASRITGGQKGFTLIEMIVVVGIIAVLAAVIVPNIGKFIGSGEQGAKDAEFESVQIAMNAMMADNAVVVVVDHSAGTSTSIQDWTAQPVEDAADIGTVPLGTTYLQNATTVYFYCWNGSGQLTAQHEAATAC